MATDWMTGGIAVPFNSVWKTIYHPRNKIAKWAIARDGFGGWYLTKRRLTRTPEDIGPFSSKEAAAACYETLGDLD